MTSITTMKLTKSNMKLTKSNTSIHGTDLSLCHWDRIFKNNFKKFVIFVWRLTESSFELHQTTVKTLSWCAKKPFKAGCVEADVVATYFQRKLTYRKSNSLYEQCFFSSDCYNCYINYCSAENHIKSEKCSSVEVKLYIVEV